MRPDSADPGLPPVAALLRRPAVLVGHEVMASLRDAGFSDVLRAHLGVFQYPGPDGLRPQELASRTMASKQAMNHLLHQLESGGYLFREPHPQDRRLRVVRLTERGRAASAVIRETVAKQDVEWRRALGHDTYAVLARTLEQLHGVLETRASTRR
jgi:DNA-binding MarR family transcriptional regulator